jgi:ankyrin repeat protein
MPARPSRRLSLVPQWAALALLTLLFSDPAFSAENHGDAGRGVRKIGAMLEGNAVELLLANKASVHSGGWTPLHFAVDNGKNDVVALLRQHGGQNSGARTASQPSTASSRATASARDDFCNAAARGDLAAVTSLLAGGADVNSTAYNAKADNGQTALMLASANGHTKIVQLLLAKGAAVNAKTTAKIVTAMKLSYDLSGTAEIYAAGSTALMFASARGHQDVVQLLLVKGAAVNTKNLADETALIDASANGHTDVVKLLLANKADVNARTKNGFSALKLASRNGQTQTADLLIKAGAEPEKELEPKAVELFAASTEGNLEKVRALVKDDPRLVFSKDSIGMTPLHWAAWKGHKDVVECLVASKADVNSNDSDGYTPLRRASDEGHKEVVEFLGKIAQEGTAQFLQDYAKKRLEELQVSERKAEELRVLAAVPASLVKLVERGDLATLQNRLLLPGTNPNEPDNSVVKGWTALMEAANSGNIEAVNVLLGAGASVNARTESGRTALDIALQGGKTQVVNLLRSRQ